MTSAENSGRPAKRRPRLPQSRAGRIAALLTLLTAGGVWLHFYRGTGWTDYINPVSWYHRFRGDDLYTADEAFLSRGNRAIPEVALTFDDGPHPASRGAILDTLKRYGVHATFFDVGKNMALHPDLMRRTLAEGHEVANHSYSHLRMDQLSAQDLHRELNDTDILYYALTGRHLDLMRPPGMRYDAKVLAETRKLGYIVVSYTSASGDFDRSESPDAISERTLRRLNNGGILLLHDYPATAAALPGLLDTIRQRGFKCVTVTEMLGHLPSQARSAAAAFIAAHADPEAAVR